MFANEKVVSNKEITENWNCYHCILQLIFDLIGHCGIDFTIVEENLENNFGHFWQIVIKIFHILDSGIAECIIEL